MIEKETLIILGAGASKPYGFPLGSELRDSIIQKKDEMWLYNSALIMGFSDEEYAEFAKDLAHSGFSSVDAFLENNVRWIYIGKSAIALDLLGSEHTCEKNLFPPHQPLDHWYEALWSRLRAPSWAAFKRNPVSIVTFNYDRSLEHYLIKVLCNNYGIKPATAMRGLSVLPIVHVHGDLGDYIAPDGEVDFSRKVDQSRYDTARGRIKIVHETLAGTKEFAVTRKCLKKAERILFIGFGYHSSNMVKLGIKERVGINGLGLFRAFGTHKGIKSNAWKRICGNYGFCYSAQSQGGSSITEFINEWLE